MDWDRAIDLNRTALLRILATLFAMAGLAGDRVVATLPHHVYYFVLRVLKTAESAARRLVVIAARGLAVNLPPIRPNRVTSSAPAVPTPQGGAAATAATRALAFPLIEPFKRLGFAAPKRGPGLYDPAFMPVPGPSPYDPVGAGRLCLRLQALKCALDDLPAQARRLAHWHARQQRTSSLHPNRPSRSSSIRRGRPPGYRQRPFHEVDDILSECDGLARYALAPPGSR